MATYGGEYILLRDSMAPEQEQTCGAGISTKRRVDMPPASIATTTMMQTQAEMQRRFLA
jgi:hypothetical protein